MIRKRVVVQFVFALDDLGSRQWDGNVQPTYREMATIASFQYMPVIGIESLIDPEQKRTVSLPRQQVAMNI
jgi:hypothetical protein